MAKLIVDTCALLDLARAPAREEVRALNVAAARMVLSAIRATPATHELWVSEHVRREFDVHVEAVTQEAGSQLRRLAERWQHTEEIGNTLGVIVPPILLASAISVVASGRALATDLLAAAMNIAPSVGEAALVMGRVIAKRTPARAGKDSTMDCAILEGALRVARASDQVTVFLTSNKNDFAPNGPVPADLASDLSDGGLMIAFGWAEAWHHLGGTRVP